MHPACPEFLIRLKPNKKPPMPEPASSGYLFRKMEEVNKRGMQWILKCYALVGKQLKEFDTQEDCDHHFNDVSLYYCPFFFFSRQRVDHVSAPCPRTTREKRMGSSLRERVARLSKSNADRIQARMFKRSRGQRYNVSNRHRFILLSFPLSHLQR